MSAQNPESLPAQGSNETPPPAQQPAQQQPASLSVDQFIEMINALPDKVAEAMQQKLAVKPAETPASQGQQQQGGSTQQQDQPGGKFFGYPSMAHWFAGDKGQQ